MKKILLSVLVAASFSAPAFASCLQIYRDFDYCNRFMKKHRDYKAQQAAAEAAKKAAQKKPSLAPSNLHNSPSLIRDLITEWHY